MKFGAFFLLLVASLFLQITSTFLPLTFIILLVWSIETDSITPFILAFFAGCLLDIFLLRIVGTTALYYLAVLLLVFLYERKFEVRSIQFVFFLSLVSTLFYFFIFHGSFQIVESLICSAFGVLLFAGSNLLFAKKKQTFSPLV